jgi:PadR family transcriptional regulator, regulatory protein PadR
VPPGTGDLLQGTLGILILKALAFCEMHGYGIARWIQDTTGDVLQIEEGSLYPALRRLEDRGFVESRWGISDNNRRARFYALTASGRQHLRNDASMWIRFAEAVMVVLSAEPATPGARGLKLGGASLE